MEISQHFHYHTQSFCYTFKTMTEIVETQHGVSLSKKERGRDKGKDFLLI